MFKSILIFSDKIWLSRWLHGHLASVVAVSYKRADSGGSALRHNFVLFVAAEPVPPYKETDQADKSDEADYKCCDRTSIGLFVIIHVSICRRASNVLISVFILSFTISILD